MLFVYGIILCGVLGRKWNTRLAREWRSEGGDYVSTLPGAVLLAVLVRVLEVCANREESVMIHSNDIETAYNAAVHYMYAQHLYGCHAPICG